MRALSHSVFCTLALSALLACGTIVVGVLLMVGQPFIGFSLVREGLVNPVGLDTWGGKNAGFRPWDRIVAVDGHSVFGQTAIVERAFAEPTGTKIAYEVRGRDGDTRIVRLETRIFTASDLLRSHSGQALLGLVFVLIAVLLYVLRPATVEAWSFFALFASMGVAMASVVDLTLLWLLPPLFPLLGPFLGTLGIILVGVMTGAYTQTARGSRAMWALTCLASVVSAVIATLLLVYVGDATPYVIADKIFYTWLATCTALALGLLAVGYFRAKGPLRRARVRQILWAWPVGAGIPILNLFLGNVLQVGPTSLIWNGFLLLVPLSTADAIVRNDLLKLDRRARRIVGELTVTAVVGMALGVALWTAVQLLHIDHAPAMVALAALLFAVMAPLTHRVQSYIEALLRSRRYDSARLVAEFTASASTSTHLADVIAQLSQTLAASIQPASFELYRHDAESGRLIPQLGADTVEVDSAIRSWLSSSEPTILDDERARQRSPSLKDAALVVRLAVANAPHGVLVVSSRTEGTAYDESDVRFVGALAGPLAACLVNALAFEAVERLNHALEARVAARTAELEATNNELGVLNRRKDELVATISHDFRTPLAIIRSNLQTITRDLARMHKDDIQSFLEGAQRQEARLTALCTNLLDLQRLKHKRPCRDPVDLSEVSKRLIGDLQARATSSGVTLAVNVDAGAPVVVHGDADRLGQLLQNLIDNALKFTPRDGRIDVNLKRNDGAHALLLEVKDTGCGVPAEAVPRLFEAFYQVPSHTHAGQGSGLGLAIVKAVVDAHGGEIVVRSVEGKGTAFLVSMPGEAPQPALQVHSTVTA